MVECVFLNISNISTETRNKNLAPKEKLEIEIPLRMFTSIMSLLFQVDHNSTSEEAARSHCANSLGTSSKEDINAKAKY